MKLLERIGQVRQVLQGTPVRGRATVALFLASLACLQQANNQALAAETAPAVAASQMSASLASVARAGTQASSQGSQAGASNPTNCATVSIEVLPFEVTRNFSVSMRGLQLLRQQWGVPVGDGYTEVGLVQTARTLTSSAATSNGCVSYEFKVGYTPATLYVASDLTRDPCAFQHVLQHEEHHITLYKTSLQALTEEAAGSLKFQLENLLAGQQTSQGIKLAQQVLHARLDKIRQAHEAFDSDEEYKKNASVCDGVIAQMSKRSNRFR